MLSLDDFSEWNFLISTTDYDIDTNTKISKALLDMGMEGVGYAIHTNSIRASIKVPTGNERRDLEKEIRKIPNIIDVQITKGNRKVIRNMHENITISDSLSAIVSRFSQSKTINIEETAYDNHSQINIEAGDNSKITINQNMITYKVDESLYSLKLPDNISQDLESLKEKVENSKLESEEKRKYTMLVEKIKLSSSNLQSTISKNKELLKWIVPNAGSAFYSLIELIKLLSGS